MQEATAYEGTIQANFHQIFSSKGTGKYIITVTDVFSLIG